MCSGGGNVFALVNPLSKRLLINMPELAHFTSTMALAKSEELGRMVCKGQERYGINTSHSPGSLLLARLDS